MTENIQCSLVGTENLERFSDIFLACFDVKVGKRYFDWKYLENPAGNVIAFQAQNEVNGDIAAFYGIIPEYYMVNGKKTLIYQSMDTMTHPNYQKRGLFIKLAQMTYDYAEQQNGNLYLIGIPGISSFPGFVKKLAWLHTYDIPYLFAHHSIVRFKNLLRSANGIVLQEIQTFDEEIDQFFEQKENYQSVYKLYNKEILNWKVASHPMRKFHSFKIRERDKLVGLIIVEKEENKLKVIYCDFLNKEKRSLLPVAIGKLLKKLPSTFIYTWKGTDGNLNHAFRKAGFIVNTSQKGPFIYRVPLIVHARDKADTSFWKKAEDFEIQPLLQD